MSHIVNITYFYIWTAIVGGTLFYDYVGKIGFTFIDELLVFFIFILNLFKSKIKIEYSFFIFISLFYLFYSLTINTNHHNAVFIDFFIQVKPFLIFYCLSSLNLSLKGKYKIKIKRLVIIITIPIFIISCINYDAIVVGIMGHPSRYASLFVILGFCYYYCSSRKITNLYITLIIWAISIISFRSKAYVFFSVAIVLILVIKDEKYFKRRIRAFLTISSCTILILIIAWSKISYYFIYGSTNSDDMFARPALYVKAVEILNDYFPFGSGFGSYGTHASSVYYSPLYYKYGLYMTHGLSEYDSANFISDTYFPVYAQFGYIGFILLGLFFIKRFKEVRAYHHINHDLIFYKMQLLFFIFFFIESIVDSTFIQNRGMVMMILFTLYYNEAKHRSSSILIENTNNKDIYK